MLSQDVANFFGHYTMYNITYVQGLMLRTLNMTTKKGLGTVNKYIISFLSPLPNYICPQLIFVLIICVLAHFMYYFCVTLSPQR